jgi:hypothetical protein
MLRDALILWSQRSINLHDTIGLGLIWNWWLTRSPVMAAYIVLGCISARRANSDIRAILSPSLCRR